jgi:hypothetical protein
MARVELPAKVIRFRSFASKFAHYFIDAERFPILDSYAESMVSLHLGPRSVRDASQPYAAFVENLHTLKRLAGYTGSMRALDQYLWLAGQYQAWRRNADRPLNGEIRDLFEKRPDLAGLLDGE